MKDNKTIFVPEILLPKFHGDKEKMKKWSVIACDQFTSDQNYWKKLDEEVGSSPSTLRLIYPEAYLGEENGEKRIAAINKNMEDYLASGVLTSLGKGFILTERETLTRKEKRYGIILAVDLEKYSYEKKSDAAIRASEATVPERLPPRIKIRRGAKLELPHVLILFDATEEEIFGKFLPNNRLIARDLVYDFDLNADGGHLRGWHLSEEESNEIISNLYNTADEMLFAVGDGNHSLATAKKCWEEIKETLSEEERKTHPARFALCEAVSIYSPAIVFEPIHRYVKDVNREDFIGFIKTEPILSDIKERGENVYSLGDHDAVELIRAIDKKIAEYIAKFGGEVDYIHGEKELETFAKANGVGFLMKTVSKDGFFKEVAKNGSLPKKTFSMGEGREKRYYTECKKIY
ncbi:MAG: DUF1015 domain-containing protein [Clostridia bacterium]|nr:DUF1015 domain-containing protein [Clostridia bacterium]